MTIQALKFHIKQKNVKIKMKNNCFIGIKLVAISIKFLYLKSPNLFVIR